MAVAEASELGKVCLSFSLSFPFSLKVIKTYFKKSESYLYELNTDLLRPWAVLSSVLRSNKQTKRAGGS